MHGTAKITASITPHYIFQSVNPGTPLNMLAALNIDTGHKKCSYVQMKGGPLPTGECHKGGMACEKMCGYSPVTLDGSQPVALPLESGSRAGCKTVMEEVCEEVKRPKCQQTLEPVCTQEPEEVCEDVEVEEDFKEDGFQDRFDVVFGAGSAREPKMR